MREVLDAAPALIAIVSADDLRHTFANPAYCALFPGGEPLGKTVLEVGGGDVLYAIVAHVVRTGTRQRADGMCFDTEAAGPRFVDLSAQALRKHGGEIDAVLIVAADVTARVRAREAAESHEAERTRLLLSERAAREEAERANRTKDEFLATVSHELRTPLNAILGWVGLARNDASVDLAHALEVIERNARAQARIVDDVLDVSRIVSGTLRLERTEVSVRDVLVASLEALRPAVQAKGIKLSETISTHCRVLGDAERLRQIITNVLSNAVKFTATGGHIVVVAHDEGEVVAIRVDDDGQGIGADFLPHLFEAFQQADGSLGRRHGGLGLGLAIAQQLVVAHGGSIRAASAGIGKGASFCIELPHAVGDVAPARRRRQPSETGEARDLEAIHILVVEDQDDSRELLVTLLESRGAVVAQAACGEAGLELLQRGRPDVLVSDIGMPGMDGLALIREIRRLPVSSGGGTLAVALTAYVHSDERRRALAAGFDVHLGKPLKAELLVSTVRSLVTAREATQHS